METYTKSKKLWALGVILALAYMLYYLLTTWLQLQKDKIELKRVSSDKISVLL